MAKKKPAKKSAAKGTKATKDKKPLRRPKEVTRVLRPEERARMLKPSVGNYEEIAEAAISLWKKLGRVVHVVGMTPARMAALFRGVKKAQRKQELVENLLRKAKDARLMAESLAWKALLDLKASVENAGRQRPDLLGAFAALVNLLKKRGGRPSGGDASKPVDEAGPERDAAGTT